MNSSLSIRSSGLLYFGLGVVTMAMLALQSFRVLQRARLTTDFISFALTSVAPILKIGQPYVDYWGINPPGLIAMLWSWAAVFGHSLQSFHLLYLISLGMSAFLTWYILEKSFTWRVAIWLYVVWLVLFFSNTTQSQFFPSEINGYLMTVIGIALVWRQRPSFLTMTAASFFLILAGQMKEVYAFSGLIMVPHVLLPLTESWQRLMKTLVAGALGVASAIGLLLAFLWQAGALQEYQDITAFKAEQFGILSWRWFALQWWRALDQPLDRLWWAPLSMSLLFALLIICGLVWIGYRKRITRDQLLTYSLIATYYIGSSLGYAFQNRYGQKYEMAMILPTILFIGVSVQVVSESIQFVVKRWRFLSQIGRVVGTLLVILFLFPQPDLLGEHLQRARSYRPSQHLQLWLSAENGEALALEHKIARRTQATDCLVKVYGWAVGDVYLYAQRPSCSKYFLINLLPPERYGEYIQQLAERPPSAIVYTRYLTDFKYQQFEAEVFNFPLVLETCYRQDEEFEELYWARFEKTELSQCLLIGLPGQSQAVEVTTL